MTDRHTCKLCFRRFSNGRALGGHMRSHVTFANNATTIKPSLPEPASPSSSASASHGDVGASEQVADLGDQAAAALMADREEAARAEDVKQLVYYGLRENPRKSFRLVDPEFSATIHTVEYGGAGVVLQDRESETESSKPPSLRLRSKRRRRASPLPVAKSEPSVEPEPVSSISDDTPEEGVARCLMMLSRDAWENSSSPAAKSKCINPEEMVDGEDEEEEEEEEQNSDDDSEEELVVIARSKRGGRRRYRCDTCKKVFRSYQALGGHRASHKKIKSCRVAPPVAKLAFPKEEEEYDAHPNLGNPILVDADSEVNATPSTGSTERRIHECPVCFRVFVSGQALGGHKRSHLGYSFTTGNPAAVVVTGTAAPDVAAATNTASAATYAASPADANRSGKLLGEGLIDLNMPPPMDEEVETSAVFDGEH